MSTTTHASPAAPPSRPAALRLAYRRHGLPAARALALPFSLVAAMLLGIEAVSQARDEPSGLYLKDPAAVAGDPFYVGFASNVGVLGWWTAASASLVAVALLWRDRRADAFPLLAAAALTIVLALDDLFMLHESALPAVGVPQVTLYVFYALASVFLVVRWRSFLARTEWPLLAVAVFLLGCSVGIDVLNEARGAEQPLIEDGTKLLAIMAWATYFVRTSIRLIRSSGA